MTGADIVDNRVRYILNDTDGDPAVERWSDSLLLAWLNDGSRLIAERKPESLLSAAYTQTSYADIGGLGSTSPLPDKYRECLVDYVCSRAFAHDAQDEHDLERSRDHMNQFFLKSGIVVRR